jgi:uncharacterized protein involved in type VI secretion and phage assembly
MSNGAMNLMGLFRGEVVNNVDPNRMGRLQISVPSVFGDINTLTWAMPCVPYAGPGVGMFLIPPVGARLWIQFEGGNPRLPVWMGCFWDSAGDVPASPPIAGIKILKTDTATITIADGPGPASVTIEGQGGLKITMGPQGIEITSGQGATVSLQGPKTSVNGSALEVT